MIDIKYYQKCRNIQRLNGVYTQRDYNLMEHQWMVGVLFRQFASLEDVSYDINVWDIILKHDLVETITMDLPWPVKNFNNETKEAWETIEKEIGKEHFQFEQYSDESIKSNLNPRQFALFKACDTLDLLIFVKEEIEFGNDSKEMLEVERNCLKILGSLEFKFPKIYKFIQTL